MKQKGAVKGRKGDAITLPLEFFHHHIGRLVDSRGLHRKEQSTFVVPVAPQQNLEDGVDVKPVWQQFLDEPAGAEPEKSSDAAPASNQVTQNLVFAGSAVGLAATAIAAYFLSKRK